MRSHEFWKHFDCEFSMITNRFFNFAFVARLFTMHRMTNLHLTIATMCVAICFTNVLNVEAQFPVSTPSQNSSQPEKTVDKEDPKEPVAPKPKTWPKIPETAKPLNKKKTVFLDAKKKTVWLKTEVVMSNGLLEMLCCLNQTKEHESIVSLDAKAAVVHAALLAAGAKTGKPVQFEPEFIAPTGHKISIYANWMDKEGKVQRADIRNWMETATRRYFAVKRKELPKDFSKLPEDSELKFDRKFEELVWFGPMSKNERDSLLKLSKDKSFQADINSLYENSQPKPMKSDWVFAGSYFFEDPDTKEQFYAAESGDLICVANFPTAMIDVGESSSKSNGELNYAANPKKIPPLGTGVFLELVLQKPKAPVAPTKSK